MKIYASNLCKETTEDQLRTAFSAFGKVDSVGLGTDKVTNKPNQRGWVVMKDDKEANAAIKGLQGSALGTQKITVSATAPAATATSLNSGSSAKH